MPEYFLPRRSDEPREASAPADIVESSEGVTSRATEDGIEISLPEGQRITIGALPPGTVVEVISWQGTGSPGPKASRLLLGAARTDAMTVHLAPAVEIEVEPVAVALPPKVPEPTTAPVVRTLARPRRWLRWVRRAAWTAGAIAVVLAPQVVGLIRWTVVDRGPSWALGGTRGSIAIASGDLEFVEGERAIVQPRGSDEDWFGEVVPAEAGGLAVAVGSVQVPIEGEARSVRVIVPWIGYPAIWIRSLLD